MFYSLSNGIFAWIIATIILTHNGTQAGNSGFCEMQKTSCQIVTPGQLIGDALERQLQEAP